MMQTQSLSCCISCFPGEVVNKNTALYTECLGLSFHLHLKKGVRALESGMSVEMGWSGRSPITPHHGSNQAINDCQPSATMYYAGCPGPLHFYHLKFLCLRWGAAYTMLHSPHLSSQAKRYLAHTGENHFGIQPCCVLTLLWM